MKEISIKELAKVLQIPIPNMEMVQIINDASSLEFNPKNDWLYIGLSSLKKAFSSKEVGSMCIIGSGNGIDAILTLYMNPNLKELTVTDISSEILDNVKNNIEKFHPLTKTKITYKVCFDCDGLNKKYDLIYANLPVLLVDDNQRLEEARASTTLAPKRRYQKQDIDIRIKNYSLSSQFYFLNQAQKLLSPDGVILNLIGGRIPYSIVKLLFEELNLDHKIMCRAFMIQSDEEFLQDYASFEDKSSFEFQFYNFNEVKRLLSGNSITIPAILTEKEHIRCSELLLNKKISARIAFKNSQNGISCGHFAYSYELKPK